jgi:hypothetical protein
MVVSAKAGNENTFKKFFSPDTDTLNILISAANHIYYYDSPIAEHDSNFKACSARDIRYLILLARDEAKKKGDSLIIVLKIQEAKALNDGSKRAVEYIRKQPGYMEGELTWWEKRLKELTEKP